MKKKIIAVHLFNDYSGSPLVFKNVLKGLLSSGYKIDLFISGNNKGFLSEINGINYKYFRYIYGNLKVLTLIKFLYSQAIIFFKLLRYNRNEHLLYVNTILPFGALLAGKLLGISIICHLHETSIKPRLLKNFLLWVVGFCAKEVIYVSNYLSKQDQINPLYKNVVYNALSDEFINKSLQKYPTINGKFRILMLSSLKQYKGIDEFVKLSTKMPNYDFELVLNTKSEHIKAYFGELNIPNLKVYPVQKNTHAFYERAHLVLNLSHPEKWIETFGMTVLEAMSYGTPVIVPPIGGITELVENGINGFKLDQRKLNQIERVIRLIRTDLKLFNKLSINAKVKSHEFSIQKQQKQISIILDRLQYA